MASLAFGIPVPPDKVAESRATITHLIEEATEHFHNRKTNAGYDRVRIYHQTFPVEQFVFYLEADDLHAAMETPDADHEFEEWFQKKWEELSGVHIDHIQPHISELVMDWHPEHGPKGEHHD